MPRGKDLSFPYKSLATSLYQPDLISLEQALGSTDLFDIDDLVSFRKSDLVILCSLIADYQLPSVQVLLFLTHS